jgi:Domain of unknown function (DUF3883)
MSEDQKRSRINTEAIIVGYAMSRLDRAYWSARNCVTWEQAYAEAASTLARPPDTFKNLRDEFDPVHSNPRRGWHQRLLRPDRQRILDELKDVSDDAILELVDHILKRDEEAVAEAVDSLAVVNRIAHNVAERLLTGRRAEEYFLHHSEPLIHVPSKDILDCRQSACGYDFGVQDRYEWAIEVKGIKQLHGAIQFTDREWSEAKLRRADYWVIVVGNLAAHPIPRIIRDPHSSLKVHSKYRQSITVEWHSTVSVQR